MAKAMGLIFLVLLAYQNPTFCNRNDYFQKSEETSASKINNFQLE